MVHTEVEVILEQVEGVGSTMLGILGSGSGGGIENAGGSKPFWFGLANVGSAAGREINFF